MSLGSRREWRQLTAIICVVLVAPGAVPLVAQQTAPTGGTTQPQAAAGKETHPPKSADQMDSLVAPIALYPDPLLAQMLAASTYPLEIVQAQRWLKANQKLTGENLTKAAAKETWDTSVQALVAFPQALKMLDENIQWTTDLGNAFLDQQSDVMESVQRMRKKAKDGGKLATTKEQNVEVKTVESKTVIVIEPSDPQVIYVPSYNPTVVYGAPPAYAYPPMYYPPSTGAVVATAAVSFGAGVMMGAMFSGCCGGGGWGWGASWGGNNVTINNNFHNRYGNTNVNTGNRNNVNGGNRTNVGNGNWQHNSAHRGAVPYSNASTAQRFGGAARDSAGGAQRSDRSAQARNTAAADNRGGDRGQQSRNRDAGGGREAGGNRGQAEARGAGQDRGGSQDRVGNRNIGSDSGRQSSALGGSESRARAEASSNRGFSSSRQSSSSGGGASRSSSSRSSGSRGGGGRRR